MFDPEFVVLKTNEYHLLVQKANARTPEGYEAQITSLTKHADELKELCYLRNEEIHKLKKRITELEKRRFSFFRKAAE